MLAKCDYCGLPTRIHFAWCQESGIKSHMPPDALRPAAVVFEIRELRQPPLGDYLKKLQRR